MRFAYYTTPVNMLAAKGLRPDLPAPRLLQLQLPLPLPLPLQLQLQLPLTLTLQLGSPSMATRRRSRNRIRSVRCLSEASFGRFPISVPGTCAVRAQRGPPSSGSPSLGYFSWR